MKILVVDHDTAFRGYLEEILSLLGHRTVCVSDGYDAIDYVMEHNVDLAYIDIDIPGIDGFQTFKKIREIDLNVSSIMIFKHIDKEEVKKRDQEGVLFFLEKPFTVYEIELIDNSFMEVLPIQEDDMIFEALSLVENF